MSQSIHTSNAHSARRSISDCIRFHIIGTRTGPGTEAETNDKTAFSRPSWSLDASHRSRVCLLFIFPGFSLRITASSYSRWSPRDIYPWTSVVREHTLPPPLSDARSPPTCLLTLCPVDQGTGSTAGSTVDICRDISFPSTKTRGLCVVFGFHVQPR